MAGESKSETYMVVISLTKPVEWQSGDGKIVRTEPDVPTLLSNRSEKEVQEFLKRVSTHVGSLSTLYMVSTSFLQTSMDKAIALAPAYKQPLLKHLLSRVCQGSVPTLSKKAHCACLPIATVEEDAKSGTQQLSIVYLGGESKSGQVVKATVEQAFGSGKGQDRIKQVLELVLNNQKERYGNYGKTHISRWRLDCNKKQDDAFVYCLINYDPLAEAYRLYVGQAGLLKSRFQPVAGKASTNSHIRDILSIAETVVGMANADRDPVAAVQHLASRQYVDLAIADTWLHNLWTSKKRPDPCLPLSTCLFILEAVPDRNQLDAREIHYIQLFDTCNPARGYNISKGIGIKDETKGQHTDNQSALTKKKNAQGKAT